MHLKNFKGFLDSKEINIAPITLLSGQNSSGKSSIIQSLLLLKQTIESPVYDEPLLINGTYVSLGDFSDIYNHFADQKTPLFFSINFTDNESKNKNEEEFEIFEYDKLKLKELNLSLSFNKKQTNSAAKTELSKTSIRSNNNFEITYEKDISFNQELLEKYKIIEKDKIATESPIFKKTRLDGFYSEDVIGFLVNTFLPERAVVPVNFNLYKLQLEILIFIVMKIEIYFNIPKSGNDLDVRNIYQRVNLLEKRRRVLRRRDEQRTLDKMEDLIRRLEELFINTSTIEKMDTIYFYLQRIDNNTYGELVAYIEGCKEKYNQVVKEKANLNGKSISLIKPDEAYSPRLDSINNFIEKSLNNVYYLGPLREEPRSFYSRFGSTDPLYVGQKGENVAFVLKHYSTRQISAVLPPSNGDVFDPINSKEVVCTLGEAVESWLNYIGIAKEVTVDQIGKFGLTIQADIYGKEKKSDLTNVGVGVSQVLPIIVLGLASKENATLLFEQPELHLHPYVQSRLGDFFVSLSQINKQIIAETHSEHLINRMRLQIAKGYLCYDQDIVIYFCERRSNEEGSEITKVKIDEFGSIDYYPKGFFDETEKQLEAILMAAFDREI